LVDRLPDSPKQLAEGLSHEGETASADPNTGILTLEAPNKIDPDPDSQEPKSASVGLFRTGLSVGIDTAFRVQATFSKPRGPLDDTAWSVSVAARDGGLDDHYDAKRVSVTLRVKQGHAALNIGAGADASKPPAENIDDNLYNSVFNGDQQFTLELYVDHTTGRATASLIVDGQLKTKLPFNLDESLKSTVFTTVGATLTDCCLPKAELSAALNDFQFSGHKAVDLGHIAVH